MPAKISRALLKSLQANGAKIVQDEPAPSVESIAEEGRPARRHKHNARKTKSSDGQELDGSWEGKRYERLKVLQAAGAIKDLKRLRRGECDSYEIIPGFERDGKKFQRAVYTPDFTYTVIEGETETPWVEEWKVGSRKTGKAYIVGDAPLRMKLFQYLYPDVNFVVNTDVNFLPRKGKPSEQPRVQSKRSTRK